MHQKKVILQLARGGIITAISIGWLFFLMHSNIKYSFGFEGGILLLFMAAIGILDLMGAWNLKWGGTISEAKYTPWYRCIGLWVVIFGIVLLFPGLGLFGLFDPWETHYAEVARAILERDDWISTFWEDTWFWSKPILHFWLMAISMVLFGVNYLPDGQPPNPEWAIRTPNAIMAILCMYAVYLLGSRIASRRVGLLSALVLGTMPQFFLLGHQAMTDMPFIATMATGLVFFILAMLEKPERKLKTYEIRIGKLKISLSGFHLFVFFFCICTLPQYIYIASQGMRSTYVLEPYGLLRANFWLKAGILGVVVSGVLAWFIYRKRGWLRWLFLGLLACFWIGAGFISQRIPVVDIGERWDQVIVYGGLWVLFLYLIRREQRAQKIYLYTFYLFISLATLSKGLGGFMLPGLVILIYLMVTRRWNLLRSFEILKGTLILFITAFPWYIAMVIRHGLPFLDRLLIHDHINRLAVGVHGDVGTFTYFIWQLGYGTFPWCAFLPLVLIKWAKGIVFDSRKENGALFVLLWAIVTFGLFSLMITKFHHYISPVLPPLAVLCALFLDDLVSGRVSRWNLLLIGAIAIYIFVGRDLAAVPDVRPAGYERLIHLFIYDYTRPWPEGFDFSGILTLYALIGGVILCLFYIERIQRYVIWVWAGFAASFAFWVLNDYLIKIGPHWTQKHLIETYYAKRNSPAERLVAWQMNWKGENFYTGNRVVVYVSLNNEAFLRFLEREKGRRHFFILERTREARFRRLLSPEVRSRLKVADDSSNKFILLEAKL